MVCLHLLPRFKNYQRTCSSVPSIYCKIDIMQPISSLASQFSYLRESASFLSRVVTYLDVLHMNLHCGFGAEISLHTHISPIGRPVSTSDSSAPSAPRNSLWSDGGQISRNFAGNEAHFYVKVFCMGESRMILSPAFISVLFINAIESLAARIQLAHSFLL